MPWGAPHRDSRWSLIDRWEGDIGGYQALIVQITARARSQRRELNNSEESTVRTYEGIVSSIQERIDNLTAKIIADQAEGYSPQVPQPGAEPSSDDGPAPTGGQPPNNVEKLFGPGYRPPPHEPEPTPIGRVFDWIRFRFWPFTGGNVIWEGLKEIFGRGGSA